MQAGQVRGVNTKRLGLAVGQQASGPTVKKIQATLPVKLQVWGPRLGGNAPTDVPVPEVMIGNTILLEGETLEVRGLDDSLPQRSYVWIPSLKAIVGGINVFAGLHAWTADTQTEQERGDWNRKLGTMAALRPATVVPGTCCPGRVRTLRNSPTPGLT